MGSIEQEEDLHLRAAKEAVIYVNGVRRILPDGLAHLSLLQYLRGLQYFFFLILTFFLSNLCC